MKVDVEFSQMLERLILFESDVLYQTYASEDEPEFIYVEGTLPILISAPHGAAHTRNGKYKGEDEYTAAFAQLIAEETGAHCIYARRKSKTDPNTAKDAPYKEKVREIAIEKNIRFVIDLHGMWQHHEAAIELGTRDGRSCSDQKELIISSLKVSGFIINTDEKILRLRVDSKFRGNGSSTREPMVKFVSERLEIPAAQFEINAANRIVIRRGDAAERDKAYRGNPELIEKTAKAFITLVNAFNQNI